MMLKSAPTGNLLVSKSLDGDVDDPVFDVVLADVDDGGEGLPVSKMMPDAAVPTVDDAEDVGEPCRLRFRVRVSETLASFPRTTALAAAILLD